MNFNELPEKILPLRDQAKIQNEWLRYRLDTIIPAIMRRTGIDMWVIIAREYNEDPVMMSLLPEPAMSARRRTMLLFALRPDGTAERLTLDRYGHGDFYAKGWNPDTDPDQYACLARHIRERNPQKIGLNFSEHFAFGDGISWREYRFLADALGNEIMARVVSADALCLGWLETRIPAELEIYPQIVAIGHTIIAQAYSRAVIEPGTTTTDDVVWWMRQTMHRLGLQAWFQPSVEIQAAGQRFDAPEPRKLILPGDLLHCDMGFRYLGLCTDQQQHAYILKPGEGAAPLGLQNALQVGNRLQDIHMRHMVVGQTGNEVLSAALQQAEQEDINATVYSHPLGFHGHAAGPTIGLWDQQGGVPGKGDYPLFDRTVYSIELNAKAAVAEWGGQEVRIALEEDAVLVDGSCEWLDGRQDLLYLV